MYAFTGLGVSVIGLLVNVVSIIIPYWIYIYDNDHGINYIGLWTCGNIKTCYYVLPLYKTNGLIVCKAMIISAALCLFIGTNLEVHGLRSNQVFRSAGIIVTIGGVCSIAAGIVFVSELIGSGYIHHLHAGFSLAIIGGVLGVVGGALLIKTAFRNNEYSLI